ncbi:MAG: RraA family protein [Chloroflexi bacterium]|nr:RraA family protein [Chloroflexota bacterium]
MNESQAALMRELAQYPSGYLTDAFSRLGLSGWTDGLLPLRACGTNRLAGPAVTVRYGPKRGSGATTPHSLYSIIAEAPSGSVLVVEAATDGWILGENVLNWAIRHGFVGVLVDGRVRDAAEIATMDIHCFCRGAAIGPHGTHLELADTGVAVTCAGAQVRPGDYVFGDDDGAIVVPADRLADVAYEAVELAELELEQERVIKDGRSLTDLNAVLAAKKRRRAR